MIATRAERVRRGVVRLFRVQQLLAADAAAGMLAWKHGGVLVDASVRISLIEHDVPSYFKSLGHLLRYCIHFPSPRTAFRKPRRRQSYRAGSLLAPTTQGRRVGRPGPTSRWVGAGRRERSRFIAPIVFYTPFQLDDGEPNSFALSAAGKGYHWAKAQLDGTNPTQQRGEPSSLCVLRLRYQSLCQPVSQTWVAGYPF